MVSASGVASEPRAAAHADGAGAWAVEIPVGTSARRVVVCEVRHGAEPWGDRVETRLRDAVQRLAREDDNPDVEVTRALARAVLPPWAPELERLGGLRWGLLEATGFALERAAAVGAGAAILFLHEVISLSGTREARRRNNREDVDRWLRRLSAGQIERLRRGVLAGPVWIPGSEYLPSVPLYLAMVRTDLP